MADIIIYGDPRSSYVRTARMACEEKGVAYDLEPVAPGSETIGALHPFGKIPAMRHGDFVLYETTAICRYVDGAFPGPALQPADIRDRAVMEQWISAVNDYFYGVMIRDCVLQYVFPRGEDGQPDRAVIDPALEKSREYLAILDRALEGRDWVAGGDRPSIADLLIAPIMFYLHQLPEGSGLFAPFANLGRVGGLMTARPSFTGTKPPMPSEEAA